MPNVYVIDQKTLPPANVEIIYVGRKRALYHYGNPFTHVQSPNLGVVQVETRDQAVDAFADWLAGRDHHEIEPRRRQWLLDEVDRLAKASHDIALRCFCKPRRCHGDVIKLLVEQKRAALQDKD